MAIKSVDLRRNILMNEPQRVSPEMQQRANPKDVEEGRSILEKTFDDFSIKE